MKLLAGRNITLLSALLLLPAFPLLAQSDVPPAAQADAPPEPPGGFHRGAGLDHRVDMLQRALNLFPDQTTQVKTLLERERTQMEALRSSPSLSQEDRHSQMAAIHQDTTTKMHALLTTEQASKYDVLQARMRDRRPGNGQLPAATSAGPDQR